MEDSERLFMEAREMAKMGEGQSQGD